MEQRLKPVLQRGWDLNFLSLPWEGSLVRELTPTKTPVLLCSQKRLVCQQLIWTLIWALISVKTRVGPTGLGAQRNFLTDRVTCRARALPLQTGRIPVRLVKDSEHSRRAYADAPAPPHQPHLVAIAEWPSKPSTQGRRHPVVIVTEALSELHLSSPGWAYKPQQSPYTGKMGRGKISHPPPACPGSKWGAWEVGWGKEKATEIKQKMRHAETGEERKRKGKERSKEKKGLEKEEGRSEGQRKEGMSQKQCPGAEALPGRKVSDKARTLGPVSAGFIA